MQPILIALHGVKRAGKDTTADFIEEWAANFSRPFRVKRRGFADKVKWAFARQFFPEISMEDAIEWVDRFKNTESTIRLRTATDSSLNVFEIHDVLFRDAVAQFATEGGRDIYGEDHWVDLLLPNDYTMNMEHYGYSAWKWYREFPEADICVITDERFKNENKRVSDLHGINWKIRRRDAELAVIEEYRKKGKKVHRSELGLPDEMFHYVFVNDDNDLDKARLRVFTQLDELFSVVLTK